MIGLSSLFIEEKLHFMLIANNLKRKLQTTVAMWLLRYFSVLLQQLFAIVNKTVDLLDV